MSSYLFFSLLSRWVQGKKSTSKVGDGRDLMLFGIMIIILVIIIQPENHLIHYNLEITKLGVLLFS